MAEFWDVEEEAPPVEVVPKEPLVKRSPGAIAAARERQAKIKGIEDELLEETLTDMRDVARFKEIGVIEVDDCAIPKAWIAQWGLDIARQKYRVALAGSMPSKDAPVALKMEMAMAAAIVKARATENAAPRILNATLVQINPDPRVTPEVQPAAYPRREIKE